MRMKSVVKCLLTTALRCCHITVLCESYSNCHCRCCTTTTTIATTAATTIVTTTTTTAAATTTTTVTTTTTTTTTTARGKRLNYPCAHHQGVCGSVEV